MASNEVLANGWTAVPIDGRQLFNGNTYKHQPTPLKMASIKFPSDDPIVVKVQEYAKEKLPLETFNHSMRVYYYG
jgi:cyanamide hydratase